MVELHSPDTLQQVTHPPGIPSSNLGDILHREGVTQPLPRGQDTLRVLRLGVTLDKHQGEVTPELLQEEVTPELLRPVATLELLLQLVTPVLHHLVDTLVEHQRAITLAGLPRPVDTLRHPLQPQRRVDTDRLVDTALPATEEVSTVGSHWQGCRT